MTKPTSEPGAQATPSPRKPWRTPAIVLERSLEVAAQDGPPKGPMSAPGGFLGPLGTSGGLGCPP